MDKAFRKYNRDLYKFNRRSREYNFNKKNKSRELRSAFRRYNKDYEKYQRELRKQQYQKYGAQYFAEKPSEEVPVSEDPENNSPDANQDDEIPDVGPQPQLQHAQLGGVQAPFVPLLQNTNNQDDDFVDPLASDDESDDET